MDENLQDSETQENAINKFKSHIAYKKKILLIAIVITALLCLWSLKYSLLIALGAIFAMSVGHMKFTLILVGAILAIIGSILFIKDSFKKRFRYEFIIMVVVGFTAVGGTIYSLSKEEMIESYNDMVDRYSPEGQKIEVDEEGNIVYYDTVDEYDVEMDVVTN